MAHSDTQHEKITINKVYRVAKIVKGPLAWNILCVLLCAFAMPHFGPVEVTVYKAAAANMMLWAGAFGIGGFFVGAFSLLRVLRDLYDLEDF